ncbi:MAG: cohesin domain-containing protein [Methylococcaceae bacterium]
MKKIFLLSSLLFLGLSLAGTVSAATFNLSADPSTLGVGDTATVTLTIDTEGVPVNAAEATIQYPKDLLEAVDADKSDSLFNFWVQEPTFSNTTGTLTFLGGATNGFNGASLRIARFHFKVKAEGVASIVFTGGTITASDGNGTNVLTSMNGATITGTSASTPVSGSAPPTQIVREPTPAEALPPAPTVSVPLYPDSSLWYNTLSPFLVQWNLPTDITNVATAVDQNPDFAPRTSEGLFDNKIFRVLDDGIWYLHIRFKNALGWGPVSNVRIALDTLPPSAYQIDVQPSSVTDVPTPTLSFKSTDQLSGLHNYTVQIDGNTAVPTSEGTFSVPTLTPGKHTLNVDAVDRAGNSTNASVDVTTLALTSPTISPISKTIYVGEGSLEIQGTSAYPDGKVFIELREKSGELIESTSVSPNQNGTWSTVLEHPLKQDFYAVGAIAHDARDAQSLPTFATFSVIPRPFLVLGGIQISQFWFFAFIILLLGLGYVLGWYIEKRLKEKRGWHMIIAQRDVDSAFNQVQKDLDDMVDRHEQKKLSGNDAEEMILIAKRLSSRIAKTKQYILDHIEEINT